MRVRGGILVMVEGWTFGCRCRLVFTRLGIGSVVVVGGG